MEIMFFLNLYAANLEALFNAAHNGHDEELRRLLVMPGTDINQTDHQGRTLLLIASQNGHDKVVEMLLAASGIIDINKATADGVTPLFIASQNGHDKVVEILLEASGIDINVFTL